MSSENPITTENKTVVSSEVASANPSAETESPGQGTPGLTRTIRTQEEETRRRSERARFLRELNKTKRVK